MQDREQATINSHIENRESTMSHITSVTAAMSILKLKDKYFLNAATDTDLDAAFKKTIIEIKEVSIDNPEALAAIENFSNIANQPLSELDYVTLYLPKIFQDNNNNRTYSSEKYVFPLKNVLVLAWTAACDINAINYDETEGDKKLNEAETLEHIQEQKQKNLECQKQSLINTLIELKRNPVCHTGTRHALLASLNHIHPDVNFIVSGPAFALQFYRNKLSKLLTGAIANKSITKEMILNWLGSGDATDIFKSCDAAKNTITEITTELINHGCNPAEHNVKRLLSLEQVPFCEELNIFPHKTLSSFNNLLNLDFIPESDAENENKALKKAQEWVINTVDIYHPDHQKMLLQVSTVFQCASILFKNRNLIPIMENHESLTASKALCDKTIEGINSQAVFSLPTIHDLQIKQLNAALQLVEVEKNKKFVDFFTNFFAFWNIAPNQKELYQRIQNEVIQQKMIVSDDEIKQLLKSSSNNEIDITPYLLNRIFLHAIFKEEETWSEMFANTLQHALEFVKKDFNQPNQLTLQLKKDSYPSQLLAQVTYLLDNYQHLNNSDLHSKPTLPETFCITNPVKIRTLKQWLNFAKLVNKKQSAHYFNLLRTYLISDCNSNKKNFEPDYHIDIPFWNTINNDYTEAAIALINSPLFTVEIFEMINIHGLTALHHATAANYTEIVKTLLNSPYCAPIALEIKNNTNTTGLQIAASWGYTETVKAIIASPHCTETLLAMKNTDGNTALILAANLGHTETVKAIIASPHCTEAVLAMKDNYDETALMHAVERGRTEIAKAILASPHSTETVLAMIDKNGKTALINAIERGHTEIAKAILASPHCTEKMLMMKDNNNRAALGLAVRLRQTGIVTALLASPACTEKVFAMEYDLGGNTAFMSTAVSLLSTLDKIEDYYSRNEKQIILDDYNKKLHIFKIMVHSLHCTPTVLATQCNDDGTILMKAIFKNNFHIVAMLLNAPQFTTELLTMTNRNGHTPLMMAINISPYDPSIREMIVASRYCTHAVLAAKDKAGCTALMQAVDKNDARTVRAIIASPHCTLELLAIQDTNGDNVLMRAVLDDFINMVQTLLTSPHWTTDLLKTAWQSAKQTRNVDIASLIFTEIKERQKPAVSNSNHSHFLLAPPNQPVNTAAYQTPSLTEGK